MNMLNKLSEEFLDKIILNEDLSDEPPKKFSRLIATLSGRDEFLFTFYSEHVLWEPKPGIGTCGVRPYGDGHHIVFAYDPAFVESCSKEMLYFLLGHEIYHILQDHTSWESELSKERGSIDHDTANIAMDVWINTDLYNEKTLGGFAMEPPFDVHAFRCPDKWGDTEKWVNETIKKATGKDPGEKYDGPKVWDSLYDWIKEMFKKYNIGNDDDDGEEGKNYPQPGMIIRGPNGQYGQVVEVDENTKKVTKIEPLTEEEARERVLNS